MERCKFFLYLMKARLYFLQMKNQKFAIRPFDQGTDIKKITHF